MSTATAPTTEMKAPEKPQLPSFQALRIPFHPVIEAQFGISKVEWKALIDGVFPNATSIDSVFLALSYCKARKLDPFKRNVHIVAIWNKQLGCMVDSIWPGIGELRTTAFRTGEYAGRGATAFGPDVNEKVGTKEMTFPVWAQVTLYRLIKGVRVEFCGPRVYWLETYATAKRGDDTPNEMWADRPRGQIDKCAEAAALRAAFPEEIGGEYIPEEVQHNKGLGPTVEAAPVKTLDDLSKRLEERHQIEETVATIVNGHATDAHQEPAAESATMPINTDPLARLRRAFDAATTLIEAGAVYDQEFGPEAQTDHPPEVRDAGSELYQMAKTRIRAASEPKKQKELVGTSEGICQ